MPPNISRYLVDDRVREHRVMRMLVESPLGEGLFSWLGLSGPCWFVLRTQMRRLSSSFEGDIDLLAGRLEWSDPEQFQARCEEDSRNKNRWSREITACTLAYEGGIKWPPSTDFLVAVEAKCAYQAPGAAVISEETLKSTKASRQKTKRIQGDIERLCEMGFDRVALLDMIANPPIGVQPRLLACDSENSHPEQQTYESVRPTDRQGFQLFCWETSAPSATQNRTLASPFPG